MLMLHDWQLWAQFKRITGTVCHDVTGLCCCFNDYVEVQFWFVCLLRKSLTIAKILDWWYIWPMCKTVGESWSRKTKSKMFSFKKNVRKREKPEPAGSSWFHIIFTCNYDLQMIACTHGQDLQTPPQKTDPPLQCGAVAQKHGSSWFCMVLRYSQSNSLSIKSHILAHTLHHRNQRSNIRAGLKALCVTAMVQKHGCMVWILKNPPCFNVKHLNHLD